MVEQRIENPRVGGSIPSLATKDFSGFVLTQSQALMPASLIKQLAAQTPGDAPSPGTPAGARANLTG